MSKYGFINLIDKVFVTSSIFLILFAWINFYIRDLKATFVLSLVFSFGVVFLVFHFFNKHKEKHASLKRYKKDVDEKFLAFRLMSKSQQLHMINDIVSKDKKTRIFDNAIIFKDYAKLHGIFVFTHKETINQIDLINLLSGRKNFDVVEIICCDFTPGINTNFLTDTQIILTTKKQLYDEYFFKHKTFPDCSKLCQQKFKPTLKEIFKNIIKPQKAKSYFLCGLILLFSSVILPYHTYYLIFGSALMIIAILCKLRPLFKH